MPVTFILQTDASDYGIGAIPKGRKSNLLLEPDTERRGKELFKNGRVLGNCLGDPKALVGNHFKVVTDHMALKWINSIETPSGRISRWALDLQQYDFEIAYRRVS